MGSNQTATGADGETGHSSPRTGPSGGVRYGPPPETPCALCSRPLRGVDDLVIQYYLRGDEGTPTNDGDDGNEGDDASEEPAPNPERTCHGVCRDCANEVAELVDAWTATARPPVDARRSIAAGYRAIAGDCSFCDRALAADPIVGVEYYRTGDGHDGGLGPHRHYVLCPNCVGVFEQFLDDVAAEVAV